MEHPLLPLFVLLSACAPQIEGSTAHDTDADTAGPIARGAACTEDRFESDDHPRTATRILPTDRWTATACAHDHDWYEVQVQPYTTGLFVIRTTDGAAPLNASVFDEQTEPVQVSQTHGGDLLQLTLTAEQHPRTYYIDLHPEPGSEASVGPYTGRFDLDRTNDCQPDLHEPNDAASTARPLGEGDSGALTACPTDRADWFEVDLAAGEQLTVTLDTEHADAPLHLFLLAAPAPSTYNALKDASIAHSAAGPTPPKLHLTAPAAGTYHLVVYLLSAPATPALEGASYALDLSVDPAR